MLETTTIDVRTMIPRERHPRIFETFDHLAPGEALGLIGQAAPGAPEDVATTPIGTLVERFPAVEAVLEDFGFDTCCTVEFTPLEIAEKAAIEPGPLVEALRQVTGQ